MFNASYYGAVASIQGSLAVYLGGGGYDLTSDNKLYPI